MSASAADVVERYFRYLNQESWEAFSELWHEDARLVAVAARTRAGKADVLTYYPKVLERYREHHDEPTRVLLAGDAAMVEIRFTGVTEDGRAVEFDAVDVFDIEDGRIRRLSTWYDIERVRRLIAGNREGRPQSTVTPVEIADLEKLVGTQFPGGSFTIEPWEHRLTCDVVLAPALPEGVAHPLYVYMAALGGMGITLDELFAMFGAAADSGVLFGEAAIEVRRPLRVGARYGVHGGITSAERKTGKRSGAFDVATFRCELLEGDGEVAAVSTNTFVFPRRS